jgi:chitinase
MLLAVGASLAMASAGASTNKVFVGYVYRMPAKIDFSLYTHLCHAFITADENGVIRPNKTVPSQTLTRDAHRAGVKVLLSLGGWGWDKQFAAIVSHPEAENRYIDSVMEIVRSFDYDGIDLDWEYPDSAGELAGFERLARSFRKLLDVEGSRRGSPMLQTTAVSGMPSTVDWIKNELVLESMDWLNVMTYDMAGEWTDYAGHHSPLFASSRQPGKPRSTELSIKHLLDRGLPPDRLALGIPLYGKGFAVSEPYASTEEAKKARKSAPRGGNYAHLHRLEIEEGWRRQWDDETKTPWLIAPDHSAVCGYDDAKSVALKTDWAMQQQLRGVFFWEISGDGMSDGSHPLQEAARAKMNFKGVPSEGALPE